MVSQLIEEHNKLINNIVEKLLELKNLLENEFDRENNFRINIAISDIDKTIEFAYHYIKDEAKYDPNTFRYDLTIINLIDTIKENDFGLKIESVLEMQKANLCGEIFKLANELSRLSNDYRKFLNK